MNCTRCQKRIEKGQPYHRTKRGSYHSECSKTVAPEHPAMPSMDRLIDATMLGLCYHPVLRGVIVAGTAADVKEMLRMHTASVLRTANAGRQP
jgi:hypothetical protein